MKFHSSAFVAALFCVCDVSAFAPPASLNGVRGLAHRLATSHLFETAKEASEGNVFFQNRIAEPASVESVPSAAYLLSSKFPDDPFVVQYRQTNIYDMTLEKGPILDLSVLKEITISDDNLVTVESGVTVAALAMKLSKSTSPDLRELFVSIPASSTLSIAEAALDGRYQKLNKAVKEVRVVDADGTIISKQLADVNAGVDIVVNVVLEPQKRKKTELVARWYSRKSHDTPIPDAFVSDIPEDVKIIVHKHGMFNDIPNVIVFVDGGRDLELSSDDWTEVPLYTPYELWKTQNELSDAAGFQTLSATATLDVSKKNPSFSEILASFEKREENLLVWLEKDKIRVSFDADHPPDIDDATAALFTLEGKSLMQSPTVKKTQFKNRKATALPAVTEGTVIPGFKGEVYDGVRGQMQEKRFQYATSSYDNMMNPSIIVYPLDEEDVSLAIQYARKDEYEDIRKTLANPSGRKYKVMGRGGGHQYCGVSCDNGNLIISMEHFNKLEAEKVDLKGVTGPDGKPHDVEIQLQVGTGNKLKPFAEFNNKDIDTGGSATGSNENYGWTIPHGECPTVGIGGHSQTGGYGHIARAFGLAVDYIYGFTIVLATGEIKTVNRDSQDQADKDLYWAVLGGSPGAFGVTTNLVIHPILDKDYPNSTGYARTLRHSPRRMHTLLELLEDFINRSKEDDENAIADEIDLMVTLSSNSDNIWYLPRINGLLFELECRDRSNPKAAAQMDELIERFESTVLNDSYIHSGSWDGKSHLKLSEMSLYYVRKPPAVTSTGRENKRPYRKMCYGSTEKVKEGWAKTYADLLNDVVETKDDIACVFQVVVGGGKQTSFAEANLNAIAHRDAQLHGIVFDLFRGEDDDSIKGADAFSHRFEIDVVNKHQTAYPKVMAQWASHGDLDLGKKHVWEKYFDNPDTYYKLRDIKKAIDPDDVFHSRFTIPPAED